jgi:molybdopterin converting factor small subunit
VEAERVQLPRDATLADLAKDLEARHPALDRVPLRYALGTRFAAMGAILSDGDVVALIPPVSGG